ncbi:MAG: glycosyltransferase family 4 protein [Patescibacteria group bacterium]
MHNTQKAKIILTAPSDGGPLTYTRLLEERLPAMGFFVKLVSFGPFLRYPKGIRHILFFFQVAFNALSADSVYAQDPVSTGLPSYCAARITGKKFYLKIVGDYAWEQGSQRSGITEFLDSFSTEYKKYPFLVRLFKKIQFFVASHADKIIVPSFYLKKIVTNWGVPQEKITVVYNAFNAPTLASSRDELRKKLGFSGRVITSAGRLVPWKGFDTLIKTVLPELVKKYPDIKLYILGDGPDKGYLLDTVKASGMESHVVLTGKKPQAELFEYIKGSDVFVLNTSYEGLSHLLLEVLALEIPIVTTDVGGNVEVIRDGENGILTHFNETGKITSSISQLLTEPAQAQQLVAHGKETLNNFSEEKMLSELAKQLR